MKILCFIALMSSSLLVTAAEVQDPLTLCKYYVNGVLARAEINPTRNTFKFAKGIGDSAVDVDVSRWLFDAPKGEVRITIREKTIIAECTGEQVCLESKIVKEYRVKDSEKYFVSLPWVQSIGGIDQEIQITCENLIL